VSQVRTHCQVQDDKLRLRKFEGRLEVERFVLQMRLDRYKRVSLWVDIFFFQFFVGLLWGFSILTSTKINV
jgi:hypothetical protein